MRSALLTLSLVGVLGGCGGMIGDDGLTAGRYRIGVTGDCQLPDGSACLFNEGGSDTGTTTGTTDTSTTDEQLPPEQGGCWFTGGGTFGKGQTRDSFGGNAMTMKSGSVRGEWEHVDHTNVTAFPTGNDQNLFHGQVHYIACKKFPSLSGPEVPKAEPNFVNYGGTGRFNGVDGYFFDVKAFDHAEGGIHFDRYVIDIYDAAKTLVLHGDGQVTKTDPSNKACKDDVKVTSDLAWVLEMGCLSGGNLQIHPPNAGHPY